MIIEKHKLHKIAIESQSGLQTFLRIGGQAEIQNDSNADCMKHSILTTNDPLQELKTSNLSSIRFNRNKREKFKKNQNTISDALKINTLQNQRISNICNNFLNKIKRNNIFRKPILFEGLFNESSQSISGFQLSETTRYIWQLYGSITLILIFFYYSFSLTFDISSNLTRFTVVSISALYFIGQIICNSTVTKRIAGKKITNIKQIVNEYLFFKFFVDFSMLLLIILQQCAHQKAIDQVILVLFIFKIQNLICKLQKLQRWVFKTFYSQRYWSLTKIIIFNLTFAHVIAIVLNLMVIGQDSNWQIAKGIHHDEWSVKYIWSYYWATTIMLTVGFGDIIPTTQHQALWIIFIQISSCIAFSYNISCLGNLISTIRAQGEQMSRNRKIFENLAKKRKLSQALVENVQSYIDESVNIKNIFNVQQEKQFIQNLPQGYRVEVQCETVKNMLRCIPFFGQLRQKAIFDLSKFIERSIYFPEQLIRPYNSFFKILVLQSGEISFNYKKLGSSVNGVSLNKVSRTQYESPFLINFDFITLSRLDYEVKSLEYSVIHELKYENFIESLRNYPRDYEYYCYLKDRHKNILYEYETVKCQECKQRHTLFICPKFHFIPSNQILIMKELAARKKQTNKRQQFTRKYKPQHVALKNILSLREAYYELVMTVSIEYMEESDYRNDTCILNQVDKSIDYQTYRGPTFNLVCKILSVQEDTKMSHEDLYSNITEVIVSTINKEFKIKQESIDDQIWVVRSDEIRQYTIYNRPSNMSEIGKTLNRRSQIKNLLSYNHTITE